MEYLLYNGHASVLIMQVARRSENDPTGEPRRITNFSLWHGRSPEWEIGHDFPTFSRKIHEIGGIVLLIRTRN